MNILEVRGRAGVTVTETVTDTSQSIDTGVTGIKFKNTDGDLISGLLITCETNNVKYAFGADAVSAGLGHVLVKDTDGIYLRNAANIRAFRFINSVAQSAGVIQLTPFYGEY